MRRSRNVRRMSKKVVRKTKRTKRKNTRRRTPKKVLRRTNKRSNKRTNRRTNRRKERRIRRNNTKKKGGDSPLQIAAPAVYRPDNPTFEHVPKDEIYEQLYYFDNVSKKRGPPRTTHMLEVKDNEGRTSYKFKERQLIDIKHIDISDKERFKRFKRFKRWGKWHDYISIQYRPLPFQVEWIADGDTQRKHHLRYLGDRMKEHCTEAQGGIPDIMLKGYILYHPNDTSAPPQLYPLLPHPHCDNLELLGEMGYSDLERRMGDSPPTVREAALRIPRGRAPAQNPWARPTSSPRVPSPSLFEQYQAYRVASKSAGAVAGAMGEEEADEKVNLEMDV